MVQWTAEKDQILLKGIFHFCDIKSSAPLLAYLAKQIGSDCTPKAVSHRLTNLRNTGKPLNGTPAKTASTSKASVTPKTPKSRAKKTKMPSPESDEPEGLQDGSDEGLEESPLASKKRKRSTPKKTVNYHESDGEEDLEEQEEYIPFRGWKKVKKEPIEEETLAFGENVPLEQGEEEV